MPDDLNRRTHWMLPLRSVAVGGVVFGASCLVVLVVVTAVNGDDALSTVALALAVLAFTVQLIVFIAQQESASEQTRRNEELHGKMRELLVEISEKAAGTHEDVRTMMNTTLEPFLSKYTSDAKAGGGDVEAAVSQLSQSVENIEKPPYPPRRPMPDDPERAAALRTYPDEDEVGDSLSLLKDLSIPLRKQLRIWGSDELRSLLPESTYDPGLTAPVGRRLEEEGLIAARSDAPDSNIPVSRLTDHGRQVARLLTAEGAPPAYLPGLEEIRAELDGEES